VPEKLNWGQRDLRQFEINAVFHQTRGADQVCKTHFGFEIIGRFARAKIYFKFSNRRPMRDTIARRRAAD
jgi:hypothetical protein